MLLSTGARPDRGPSASPRPQPSNGEPLLRTTCVL